MTVMKRTGIALTLCCLAACAAAAAEWHVSPEGKPEGDGSKDRPWDLQTALNHPPSVRPGDTVRVHGGRYRGGFISTLTGVEGKPIRVENAPGERAILDEASPGLQPSPLTIGDASSADVGAWSDYVGLEILTSHPVRIIKQHGSNPDEGRPAGVTIWARNSRIINCIVHDNGSGFGFWWQAKDAEISGCLIYHNGWQGPDRGHGHGIYTQNQDGQKRIIDNIIFGGFNHGMQIYGSGDNAHVNNYHVEGNFVFNSGILQGSHERNILIGGGRTNQDHVVARNCTYYPQRESAQSFNLGYIVGHSKNTTVKDNYFAGSVRIFSENGLTLTGNTFAGALEFITNRGSRSGIAPYADNTHIPYGTRPSRNFTMVRPNAHDPRRAHVAIYNWEGLDAVTVDLSAVLKPGDRYEVLDAQNFFDKPVAAGTYAVEGLRVPMKNLVAVQPIGERVPRNYEHSAPDFGAFVVFKR
jgi:hypothetical protein